MTDDQKPDSWLRIEAFLRALEVRTPPPGMEPIKLAPWQWEHLKAMYPEPKRGPYDLGGQLGRFCGIPVVVEEPPKPGRFRRLWWWFTDPVRGRWIGWRMRRRGALLDEVDHE